MHKLAFIGEERLGILFRNFGFAVFSVHNVEEAKQEFSKIVKKKEFDIVITTEDFADAAKEFIQKEKMLFPIIFVLPAPVNYRGVGIEWIREAVESAVGIDILSKKNA